MAAFVGNSNVRSVTPAERVSSLTVPVKALSQPSSTPWPSPPPLR